MSAAAKRKGARPSKARTPLDRATAAADALSNADRARLVERLGFKDPTYNGWKNYETWCVSLWIDNEEGSHNFARGMARGAMDEALEDAGHSKYDPPSEVPEDVANDADRILADSLKEWITEAAPDLGASMFSDLLGAALSEVDWHEIAHAMQGE